MVSDGGIDRARIAAEQAVACPLLEGVNLSGARGDVTLVEARMLRKGGRLAVGDVELRDASSGTLNAKLRVTCEVIPAPGESRGG